MSNDHVAIDLENINGRGNRRSVRSRQNSPNRSLTPTTQRQSTQSPSRRRRDIETANRDATTRPLIDTEDVPPHPPHADPEYEDDPPDDSVPYTPEARPGVDDSFFPDDTTTMNPSDTPNRSRPADEPLPNGGPRAGNGPVDRDGRDQPRRRFPSFPPMPDDTLRPDIITVNGVDQVVPDVNVYQQKKTLALGMVDLALLSANANQLRYVLESFDRHPYYYFSIIFISCSLILQIAVGVGLILNSRYNVKSREQICKADKINNFVVIGIFLITIFNVFVSAFGVADAPSMRS